MKKIALGMICILLFVSFAKAIEVTPDFYMRIRYVDQDFENNNNNLNYNTFRIKTSLGLKTTFSENYGAYVRLMNENRPYIYNMAGKSSQYNINEFIFESLYFDANNLFNSTLDIRIGRQNLYYGDGFLVWEGTPGDGSRSIYFNAVKFTIKTEPVTIDIVGHSGTKYEQYLPVFNQTNPPAKLNNSNEQSAMIFVKSNLSDKVYLEPFYVFKNENVTYYENIHTLGSYIKYKNNLWTVRGQLAGQLRDNLNDVGAAFGGYGFIEREKILFNDTLTFGTTYLSGNKEDTSANEGWDNLYGRGMFIWSDLLCFLYLPETGDVGYWTNLQMYQLQYKVNLSEKICISATYAMLYANESVTGTFYGTGKDRGNLTLAEFIYKFNKNIKFLVYGEYFRAGNFYNNDLKSGSFLKTELTLNF
ncbi:MAG: hypothetical protein PHR82_00910 [Endomicrobiaceae bacterium]|nr:hypothetical protein [Endomicrobiaceae bacterium]